MKNAEARKYLLGIAQVISDRIAQGKSGTGLRPLAPKVQKFEDDGGFYAQVARLGGATVRPHFVVSLENYRTDAELQLGYGVDVDYKDAESMPWLARALDPDRACDTMSGTE